MCGLAVGLVAVVAARRSEAPPHVAHGPSGERRDVLLAPVAPPLEASPLQSRASAAPVTDAPGVILDEGAVSDDPRAPEYDASRIVFDRFHGYADALWAAEPTDAIWAPHRADQLRKYTEADIAAVDPDARVEIECHTASCRVRIYSETAFLTDTMGPYPFSCMAKLAMAGTLGADGPDGHYSETYLVFHRRGVSDEGFLSYQQTYCPKEREKWMARASAQSNK